MYSDLSTNPELLIAQLDLPQNDVALSYPYQPFGKVRKRDTGVCDNPDAHDVGTNNNAIDDGGGGSDNTEFDATSLILRRILAISNGLPDNPCEPLLNVLRCLGPKVLGVVYSCSLFHGSVDCLRKPGVGIYCCGSVEITGA